MLKIFQKIFQLLFLFVLVHFLQVFSYANEIINIDNTTQNQEILSKSELFIDYSKSLKLKDIKNKKFSTNSHSSLQYGYSPNFNVWIRFTLKNSSNKVVKKVLKYDNPITTHIEFYDAKKVYKDGIFSLNYQKDSIAPAFDLILQPNETKTYYLKASSHITTLIIKLKLLDKKLHQKNSYDHKMILAMFFACMAILAVYNFFIYFFTKDKNYLFYVLYVIGIIVHQLMYTGFGNIYLFSQELSKLGVYYAEFFVAFTVFMFALLVRSFLNIKQYKKIDTLFNTILLVFPFLVFFIWYFEIFSIRNLFSFFLLVITTLILIYAIFKKNRQAYFVGFGWFMFAVSVGLMYLSSVGLIDIFIDFKYLVEVALIFEAIVFSIALADKIKQLEIEKNHATMQLVLKEQTEKYQLEKIVKQKTKELSEALDEKSLLLKEINHRVKNNMQLIVSLINLQINKIDNNKTKELLNNIKGRINAMGTFHEMLYKQDNISYIDANKYFYTLIDELRDSLQKENIKINYDIKGYLDLNDAIYCGLILNELVTNSLKHAFKNKENGTIDISLDKKFDSYILSVMDDGIGYDSDNSTTTLGTTLIDTLVKKQLKGTIKKAINNGTKTIVVWDKK